MNRLIGVASKKNSGFTLVEVILAIVILLTVGVVLLNGLIGQQLLTTKVSTNSKAWSALTAGAESIAASDYLPCGSSADTANPYKDVNLPIGVQIVKVQGITKNKVWANCGTSTWYTEAPMIQRVVLSAAVSNTPGARKITRTVIKTFSAGPGSYKQGYAVSISNNPELGPVPGPESALSLTGIPVSISNSAASSCFYLFPYSIPGIDVQILNACGGGASLSVSLNNSTAKTGNYLIDIGAFNRATGDIAVPGILNLLIKPSLVIDSTVVNSAGSVSQLGCTGFSNSAIVDNRGNITYKPCLVTISGALGTGTGQGIVFNSYSISGVPSGDVLISPAPAQFAAQGAGLTLSITKNTSETTQLCKSTSSADLVIQVLDFGYQSSSVPVTIKIVC